jgi:short-subunit dehydrogenase
MKTIRGKRAVVTGAASGIGRAIALELARHGAALFLLDIDAEQLERTADEARATGVEVIAVRCDLSDVGQLETAIGDLRQRWTSIDILINNAGILYYGPTDAMTGEQWDRLLAINLLAPIRLIRELLPAMLEEPEAHILNVCSMYGLFTRRKTAAYNTSKHALVGLSDSLRAEYDARGLGVTTLCPGFVHTDLFAAGQSNRPEGILRRPPPWVCTTPEHIAKVAIKAIRRNRGLVLVTPLARVLWYVKRAMPGLMTRLSNIGRRRHVVAAAAPQQDDQQRPRSAA